MKTAVRQTSIDAYHSIENLNQQEQEVLTAIKVLGETCIADVAAYLGWEKSTVAARMNTLKPPDDNHPDRKGLLVFVDKRKSETTGINSEFWRAKFFGETLF